MPKYLAKLWLDKRHYLAILDNALVVVTVDETGKDVEWNIFEGNKETPVTINDVTAALSALEAVN